MKSSQFLLVAGALSLACAHGATITITTDTVRNSPSANLSTAQLEWAYSIVSNIGAFATETFEDFTPGTSYDQLDTAVGTFTAGGQGSTGGGTGAVKAKVLNSSTSPFSGRFNYTPGGSNWLDSNDITLVSLDFAGLFPVNYLSFLITDVNDVNGGLQMTFNNGLSQLVSFPTNSPSGTSYLVTYSGESLSSLTFSHASRGDGWGIDNIFIASSQQHDPDPVPEPATYLMIGAGLAGLGWWRRRH